MIPLPKPGVWGLILLAFFTVLRTTASADGNEVRRVLVLNDFDEIASPGIALLDQAIFTGLSHSHYQIEWYSENLAANLYTDEASQRRIRDAYIRKYKERRPDLIIAVGPASLQFMVQSHEKFFPGVPIVFCGSSEDMLEKLKPDSNFTGVWGIVQPEETLRAALRLQPGTKHVVVVGGVGTYDRELEGIVKQSLRNYESRLQVTYLTDLDMPTLLKRVGQLPSNTIVLYTSIFQDAAGTHFIDANQSSPAVIDASNAPVFVLFDVNFGTGAVGGDIISFASDGNVAGHMAVRILDGEQPQSIPVVKNADVWTFDWRALKRWGLKESNLPSGSTVLNRRPTFWESYKWYVISGLSLILLEALLIAGLLWQRARRRRAEERAIVAYDRLRIAIEAGRFVGWDWDIKADNHRWFGDLNGMFGIPSEDYLAQGDEFRRRIHPADRDLVGKAIDDARQNRRPYTAEFRIPRDDGSVRWVVAKGRFYYSSNDEAERMLALAVDITERKLAEEALSTVSGRLIQAQEQERRRIARELHDDISQQLAMLEIDLEKLGHNPHEPVRGLEARLQELRSHVSDVGSAVQEISHRLHSSKLEFLGLVTACKGFCKEMAERHKVSIEFIADNVPSTVPQDISLILFRVLQESLQNAIRHSATRHCEVRLSGTSGEIRLCVRDRGVGFDVDSVTDSHGLGLISMRERINLVKGTISIASKPGIGTEIHVRVPITGVESNVQSGVFSKSERTG